MKCDILSSDCESNYEHSILLTLILFSQILSRAELLRRHYRSLTLFNLTSALFFPGNRVFFIHCKLVLINLIVVVSFEAGDLNEVLHDIEKFG